MRVPNTQTVLTDGHDVYDKRPVQLQSFRAVLGRHLPQVPEGAWAQIKKYSMRDLQSALDKADGKAPGPKHIEARSIKAL